MIVGAIQSSGQTCWRVALPDVAWDDADDDDAGDDAADDGIVVAGLTASPRDSADHRRAPHTVPGDATAEQLQRLMRDVQMRCPHAFRRLHALTRARLFGVILRINRDRSESEDLLQEVFVKVWQQCGRFDSLQGEVGGWLVAIARNTAISSLRRRGCRPQPSAAERWLHDAATASDPAEQLPCGAAGPLDDAMRSEARNAVQSCLLRLNVDQRESLQLAFFEGLSHQEIATRLGRPLGTVKSTVRRALLAMRPALHGHCSEGRAG